MSMSEFEEQFHSEGDNPFSLSITERSLPSDFSEDDIAFAQEMSQLFSPEEEVLPPLFAQTLLETDDPRLVPLDYGFAQKTSARVFRSLKLHRRLFSQKRSTLRSLVAALQEISMRKSLLAWASVLVLIMIFTVAFTAPSFEEGISMLLRGAPAGVLKVHHYPKEVHHHYSLSFNDSPNPTSLNLLAAEQQLHFNIYWPQYIPKNYSLTAINLYNDPTNGWADGPVIELVYNVDPDSGAIKGTGEIVIREFKPLVQTLQVVKDDAAYAIEPDANGDPRAIYVNGEWQAPNKFIHTWVYGTRSEIIYQQDGVVFWIAGDQRDGIGEGELWKLTQSLETMSFIRPGLMQDVMVTLMEAGDTVNGPFSTDVLAIDNGSDNPYYQSLSSYVSGKTTTPQNPIHVH